MLPIHADIPRDPLAICKEKLFQARRDKESCQSELDDCLEEKALALQTVANQYLKIESIVHQIEFDKEVIETVELLANIPHPRRKKNSGTDRRARDASQDPLETCREQLSDARKERNSCYEDLEDCLNDRAQALHTIELQRRRLVELDDERQRLLIHLNELERQNPNWGEFPLPTLGDSGELRRKKKSETGTTYAHVDKKPR